MSAVLERVTVAHEFVPGRFIENVTSVESFVDRLMTIHYGDRLGYYEALADCGPLTYSELAVHVGITEAAAREWLDTQVALGVLVTDERVVPAWERRSVAGLPARRCCCILKTLFSVRASLTPSQLEPQGHLANNRVSGRISTHLSAFPFSQAADRRPQVVRSAACDQRPAVDSSLRQRLLAVAFLWVFVQRKSDDNRPGGFIDNAQLPRDSSGTELRDQRLDHYRLPGDRPNLLLRAQLCQIGHRAWSLCRVPVEQCVTAIVTAQTRAMG